MQCNLCGKEAELFLTDIEGSRLEICQPCAKHGKIIKRIITEEEIKIVKKKEQLKIISYKNPEKELIEVIVEDYASLIKIAREKLNLRQDEFAKRISEKKNIIHNIETGRTEPNLALARKLEKALHITLIEDQEVTHETSDTTKSDSLTIGDMISIKNRKKH